VRHASLLLCLLLATGALVGWLLRQGTASVPMVPLAPAQPTATSPLRTPTDAPVLPAGEGPDGAERRDDARPMPADAPRRGHDRAAVDLEVWLTERLAGAAPLPLPAVDVTALVADEPVAGSRVPEGTRRPPVVGRTGADGRVQLRIDGGDGLQVQVTTALGQRHVVALVAGAAMVLRLELEPRLVVEGKVVDLRGRGVADADLVLLPWPEAGGRALPAGAGRSRADGSFRLGLLHGGRLGAVHRDHAPSALHAVTLGRPASPARATVQLQLLATPGGVRGFVFAERAPVAGAELEFTSLDTAPAGTDLAAPPAVCRTDAAGRFATGPLRPGSHRYAVRAGERAAVGTLSVAGGSTAELHVDLLAAGHVQGTVRDGEGQPIAGATVSSGAPAALDRVQAVTAADGSYHLRCVPPGTIEVTAQVGGGRRTRTNLDVAPAGTTSWHAVLGDAAATLVGSVTDHEGVPLPRHLVVARRTGRPPRSAATAVDGTFTIPLPGAQPVDVLVYAPDKTTASFARSVQLRVDPAAGPLQLVVDGRQTVATLVGQVVTEQAVPIAQAGVSAWHHRTREYVRATADGEGRFRLECVPAGAVDVFAEHPGLAGATRADIEVQGQTELDVGTFVLTPAGALHGEVRGPDGRIPDQLELTIVTGDRELVADYSGGSYRFAAVPMGQHELYVRGPSVAASRFDVTIRAGVELQQDIHLLAGVRRRILVAGARAARYVNLEFRRQDGDRQRVWVASGPLRDGGEAEFEAWLAPGSYDATATAADGRSTGSVVTFVADDAEPVRLRLR
jgi:hypothetical protein